MIDICTVYIFPLLRVTLTSLWRLQVGKRRSDLAYSGPSQTKHLYVLDQRAPIFLGCRSWARGHVTRSVVQVNPFGCHSLMCHPEIPSCRNFPKFGTRVAFTIMTKSRLRPWTRRLVSRYSDHIPTIFQTFSPDFFSLPSCIGS